MIKKRTLEYVLEQDVDDKRDIWKALLEHSDYDENFEYVCNLEFKDDEEMVNIIYKVV